ncbi:DUF5990 family protein [Taibaiella koreensis]|uniref:DUF5990 family protein n=1 Tax=Taibaiella koreensis TaxID=1268548 RepID=UPI0019690531|nr:DUF5990 family protein [Taibaiella koreensis]
MTELTLMILLERPPAGVDFGLQKGSGSTYETVQKQRSEGTDLHFRCTVNIKGSPDKDPVPDYAGPFVQGPKGARFLYIDIGTYAGQTGTEWSRRLKIPLTGIGWEQIAGKGAMVETRVPGTGKDGGPNCATVKPFPGWRSGVADSI